MPKAYTQNVTRVAGEGFIARLQFSREVPFEDVTVSAAFLNESRSFPPNAEIYVQTLQRDGTLIDSVLLMQNGIGGAQVGLHILRVGKVKRFQVVVYASEAGVVKGTLTALHGITTESSTLLKSSFDSSAGLCATEVVLPEIIVNGGCKVPDACKDDIIPLFARVAINPSYMPGVVVPIDRTCHGGVQVIP